MFQEFGGGKVAISEPSWRGTGWHKAWFLAQQGLRVGIDRKLSFVDGCLVHLCGPVTC
jgi:hypothetical protein